MSFDIALIIDSIPKMLAGIGLTFQLLFLSGILGLILAVILDVSADDHEAKADG